MKYSKLKKQNKKMKQKIERLKEDQDFLERLISAAASMIEIERKNTILIRNKLNEKTAERNALKTIFKEEIIENNEKEKIK